MPDPIAEFLTLAPVDQRAIERRLAPAARQALHAALRERQIVARPAKATPPDLTPYSPWLRTRLAEALAGKHVTATTRDALKSLLERAP
jgi:hypothetical protein